MENESELTQARNRHFRKNHAQIENNEEWSLTEQKARKKLVDATLNISHFTLSDAFEIRFRSIKYTAGTIFFPVYRGENVFR